MKINISCEIIIGYMMGYEAGYWEGYDKADRCDDCLYYKCMR